MRRLVLVAGAAAVCASVALTSCSSKSSSPNTGPTTTSSTTSSVPAPGSSSPAGATGSGQSAQITISGFAYSGDLTVTPGEKVTVTNKDSVTHTLTGKGGGFDTGDVQGNGATGSFTAPAKAGSYQLTCTFHPSMHGTLTVTG
jgi:plastocyanin